MRPADNYGHSQFSQCFATRLLSLLLIAAATLDLGLPAAGQVSSTEKPAQALMPPPRLSVTLAGMQNAGADPKLDFWRNGVLWLLEHKLTKIGSLRLIPGYQLASTINQIQAQKIGLDVEAQRVLWGSYMRQNGNWVIVFHIENVATGTSLPRISVAEPNWTHLIQTLLERIIPTLGLRITPGLQQELLDGCGCSEPAFEFLSRALQAQGLQDALAQAEWARRATELDAACPEAHVLLGAALTMQGDLTGGESELRRALSLDRNSGDAHLVQGDIFLAESRPNAAKKELDAALRAMPECVEAMIRAGECSEQLGLLVAAQRYYKQAVSADPLSTLAHAHLGRNYALSGDRQAAMTQLEMAERQSDASNVNTEQYLFLGYSALNQLPAALYHGKQFLRRAAAAHVDPDRITALETQFRDLQARCTCHFVECQAPRSYSPESLADLERVRAGQLGTKSILFPLQATLEMTNWARQIVHSATNDLERAKALFDALATHVQSGFGKTRTAKQAFSAWKQKRTMLFCQEYTYLYIALARAIGIRAYDVLVEEACDGSKTLHACAAVLIGPRTVLVDPTYFWFGAPHKKFHLLDDLQVTAVYLAEQEELSCAELGAKLDPASDFVRGNLVLMLMESRHWGRARTTLHDFERTTHHKALSDYLEAYLELHDEHPEAAMKLLTSALAINPDFPEAYLLLGTVYQQIHKWAKAREAFRNALQLPLEEEEYEQAKKAIAVINDKLTEDNY